MFSLLVANHLPILAVALAVVVILLGVAFGLFARRESTHVRKVMDQIRAESDEAEFQSN